MSNECYISKQAPHRYVVMIRDAAGNWREAALLTSMAMAREYMRTAMAVR